MAITFEPIPEWLEDELTGMVEEELLRLHIPSTLNGFHYHADAIMQTIQNPRCIKYITKELYPAIAKKYGTSSSNIERAMRTAVQRCWKSGDRETLDKMAGYHLTERPTNSEFIELVANYIRSRG